MRPPTPEITRACCWGAFSLYLLEKGAKHPPRPRHVALSLSPRPACNSDNNTRTYTEGLELAPFVRLKGCWCVALAQKRARSRRLGRRGHRSASAGAGTGAGAGAAVDTAAGAVDAAGPRQRLAAVDLSLARQLARFQRRPSLAHRFYLSFGAPLRDMRLNNGRGRSRLFKPLPMPVYFPPRRWAVGAS